MSKLHKPTARLVAAALLAAASLGLVAEAEDTGNPDRMQFGQLRKRALSTACPS
ncbi:MAG: hypothetical protein H6986_04500 [Pseudomonadales bacterium]|nr:hypothetical protein [Pseudomonadales bacterium]